ncbi:DedA family protein [bacterium]|nr:DedA family protein [bacterium]
MFNGSLRRGRLPPHLRNFSGLWVGLSATRGHSFNCYGIFDLGRHHDLGLGDFGDHAGSADWRLTLILDWAPTGGGILNRRKKPLFSPKRVRRARAYFRKYGAKVVFFARFVAGLRAVVFFMAGSMHMKFRVFILLDFLAALMSVPLWIIGGYYLGHYFGTEISALLSKLKEIKLIITWIVAALVVGIITKTLIQYRNSKRKSANPSSYKTG